MTDRRSPPSRSYLPAWNRIRALAGDAVSAAYGTIAERQRIVRLVDGYLRSETRPAIRKVLRALRERVAFPDGKPNSKSRRGKF